MCSMSVAARLLLLYHSSYEMSIRKISVLKRHNVKLSSHDSMSIGYDILYYIFVNCNWFDTRWQ